MKKYKIGIVGGGFGKYGLIPAFRLDPRCEIVSICTKTKLTSESIAKEYLINSSYTNYEKMIYESNLDIIAIATVPIIQEKIIELAAVKGINIFCEKPAGTSYSKVVELNNLIKKNKIRTCIDFPFVEIEEFKYLKNIIDKSELGTIDRCNINWSFNAHHIKNKIISWKSSETEGGGIVSMYASHSLNYIEFFFGKIKKLQVTKHKNNELKVKLESIDGIFIDLKININATKEKEHNLEIMGTKKSLLLSSKNPLRFSDFNINMDNQQIYIDKSKDNAEDQRYLIVHSLVKKFIDSIAYNRSIFSDFDAGVRNQYLIGKVNDNNSLNNWIEL
ncbi:Gfo/Idh/MocA family oxidoreductase [Pelagibacteraceae bacterium]|nr:Gfo/Idh/MocA family oxidoreductase [Pelagibacteraceae bacterium]